MFLYSNKRLICFIAKMVFVNEYEILDYLGPADTTEEDSSDDESVHPEHLLDGVLSSISDVWRHIAIVAPIAGIFDYLTWAELNDLAYAKSSLLVCPERPRGDLWTSLYNLGCKFQKKIMVDDFLIHTWVVHFSKHTQKSSLFDLISASDISALIAATSSSLWTPLLLHRKQMSISPSIHKNRPFST
jgi:hypothetical protein